MSGASTLTLGFVPLADSAPLITALEQGFFADEGLSVALNREVSWATVRDKVMVAALDGAHMLAPMVLAATLGAGSEPSAMLAPMALNRGGAALTLSTRFTAAGLAMAQSLAREVVQRREQGASQLTLATVFPYSIHNYLLRGWLSEAGIDPDRDVRLIIAPPQRMSGMLADGVIEGFCAGEPWGAAAEAAEVGLAAIRAPVSGAGSIDKVFGVTAAWAKHDAPRLQAVLRALLRAAVWSDAPGNRAAVAELLARPEYLGIPERLIARGLEHLIFHGAGANTPEPGQARWILGQMVRWNQIPVVADAATLAAQVFRPELCAQAEAALNA